MAGYTYSNDSEFATAHHSALSVMLDGFTQQRIRDLLPLRGKRCLDVGAGAGSIATWLADEVGLSGLVCAADIDVRLFPDWPGVEALERDITQDAVIVNGRPFDLVHARLVLNHLPQRRVALLNMLESLTAGGVLLTQDFWPTESVDFVGRAPTKEAADLLRKFQFHHLDILRANGNDRHWSKRVAPLLEAEGLEAVSEVVYNLGAWYGEGPGCLLLLAGLRQIEPKLLAAGFNIAEVHRIAALLMNPEVTIRGYQLYSVSVSARKPGAT